MKQLVTKFIKRHPRLYDFVNNKRTTHGELGEWLNSLEKFGPINFIQVGASDGLRWDPLRKHIVKNKWRGVLVEPLPLVYELLKKNYDYFSKNDNLQFVNAAISHQTGGTLKFWSCSKKFLEGMDIDQQLFWLRMSSVDENFIAGKIETITNKPVTNDCIVNFNTPILTISEIVKCYLNGTSPDLIFIDAEGHDDSVIYGISFELYKPRWIVFESTALGLDRSRKLLDFLTEKGYFVKVMGSDTLAYLEFH
ncbi:FkbM family methyltransferase [Marinobacter sp.]|uniref:FkbM family methyltransferase n=1 Tax=Marinobacter sp. TaxID=50741 RepID=UPI003A91CB7C